MKYLAVFLLLFVFASAYAATPFFADGGLTKNGIEWCEENYHLYQLMGDDFFEHHKHSIESRICGNLYLDSLWTYSGPDRYEILVERSKFYTLLEIEESRKEAETGIIDTKPVSSQEIPQEIIQQKKELENKTNEQKESVDKLELSIFDNHTINDNVNLDVKGGGCLIATATFGTELAPQVQQLRELRDNTILSTQSGTAFMTGFNQFYYSFSPGVADLEREQPIFKEAIKIALTPMLTSLSILNHVEINSEQDMLGYGIGIILINIGMYFVAPIMIVYKIKKTIR